MILDTIRNPNQQKVCCIACGKDTRTRDGLCGACRFGDIFSDAKGRKIIRPFAYFNECPEMDPELEYDLFSNLPTRENLEEI
jgi:hypothetical protein